MRSLMLTLAALAACLPSYSQVFTLSREQLIKYTAKNPFERFDDGRPKAPDALIEKLRALSAEDVWSVLNGQPQFANQYEGNWQILHPERRLVGRVVTAQFMPSRGDVAEVIAAEGKSRGAHGGQNQWVIDMLQPGDVLVVDLFGKSEGGTFVGDNLAVAIHAATKTGGFIVDGAIRDLTGIFEIPIGAYFRSAHPTPIRNVMLTGINIPVRIGSVTVMPGDVVLGDREGVYFIPPQFLQQIVDRAQVTKIHDEWTQEKLRTGKYKSSELYSSPRDPQLKKEYDEYLKKRMGENSKVKP